VVYLATEFNRIITLLRKEKGVTQKEAAAKLGVSQALLSHYEKGIRECGLEFIVRLADYYDVSCDYLLGRSADRAGTTLRVEDLPDGENSKEDSVYKGSVLPTLNKRILLNSLNIVYDKLNLCADRALVTEVSQYLMMAVYKMFRLLYGANSKNTEKMFSITRATYEGYAQAAMLVSETKAKAAIKGELTEEGEAPPDVSKLLMTTESLTKQYPMYTTSLVNLIKTSEERIKEQTGG
jgi:Predicted transcriptional regulators